MANTPMITISPGQIPVTGTVVDQPTDGSTEFQPLLLMCPGIPSQNLSLITTNKNLPKM